MPERLGFVHEATLRKERWVDGLGWDDTLVFGMLREEWRGEPAGFRVDRCPVIRSGVAEDAESIVRVHHASVHRAGAASYPNKVLDAWFGEPREARFARMRQAIGSADELVLVAEDGQRVIGFGSIVLSLGELRSLYVHPDAWRRGVGAVLLAELERLAAGRGLTRLQLKASLNAEPFYQASGYASDGPGVHQIGAGLTMACVKMHKELARR